MHFIVFYIFFQGLFSLKKYTCLHMSSNMFVAEMEAMRHKRNDYQLKLEACEVVVMHI